MKTPKLKRYWAMQGPIKEAADGEYVRFADVEAYTKAAIAAAMIGAADIVRNQMKNAGNHPTAMAMARVYNALANDIVESTPTDAMAALEAVKAQVRDQACETIEKHFAGSVYATSRKKALAEIRATKGDTP